MQPYRITFPSFRVPIVRHAPTTHYHLLYDLGQASNSTSNQKAWTEFVRLYEPAILRLLSRLGLQNADALEIAQEIFLQVHRSARSSTLPSQDFRPWLARVTKNKAVDLIRKNNRYSKNLSRFATLATTDKSSDPFESAWKLEVRQQLFQQAANQVQAEVQERQWFAFWLTTVELQSPASVAEKLGLSVGNVYVTKCRIMDRIRSLVRSLSFEAVELSPNANATNNGSNEACNLQPRNSSASW